MVSFVPSALSQVISRATSSRCSIARPCSASLAKSSRSAVANATGLMPAMCACRPLQAAATWRSWSRIDASACGAEATKALAWADSIARRTPSGSTLCGRSPSGSSTGSGAGRGGARRPRRPRRGPRPRARRASVATRRRRRRRSAPPARDGSPCGRARPRSVGGLLRRSVASRTTQNTRSPLDPTGARGGDQQGGHERHLDRKTSGFLEDPVADDHENGADDQRRQPRVERKPADREPPGGRDRAPGHGPEADHRRNRRPAAAPANFAYTAAP